MSEPIQSELRRLALELRRTSVKLETLIPLLQKAADRIDQLELDARFTQAQQFCAGVFNNN